MCASQRTACRQPRAAAVRFTEDAVRTTNGSKTLAAGAAFAVLVACAEDPQQLTNGRGGDGTRKNIPLPEPPALRKDDGVELGKTPGGAPTSSAPPSAADQALADLCVSEINRYRATVGSAALAGWSEADACTAEQAKSDAASMKAHGAFGQCTELGQDECPGWGGWRGDPKDVLRACLEQMWAEGPGGGHYENMKRTSFNKVSCAAFVDANGGVTAIQNFR